MTVATSLRIGLEVHHIDPVCAQFAAPLFEQLREGYEECAVLKMEGLEGWREAHRTARKRADRATRRGYRFAMVERHRRADEIHQINLSAPVRQGRPMAEGYRRFPTTTPLPDYPCERHGVHTYGVEDRDGMLVAYSWIYRSGDLALVSSILGDADHLADEIMWLLIQGIVATERDGFLVYNRWDSGSDGLRWFKEHAGFERTQVEWSEW